MELFTVQKLSGWGQFPIEECRVYRPEKRRSIASILRARQETSYLARGLGRSYGDAGVNGGPGGAAPALRPVISGKSPERRGASPRRPECGGVIDCSRLNRMLSFDARTGVLECEAGVSLAEILEAFVPRGFFLSVMPGTKFVTVGGAIANDVHGKNHHRDGTFGQFVEAFQLLTACGDVLTCSRETNRDVFWATLGGIGLTGIILTARIKLQPVESAYVVVDYLRARDIGEVLAAIGESDDQYKYSVAWVDCLARGKHLGRSILMRGNHATKDALPKAWADPFRVKPKRQMAIPFNFPEFALNPLAIHAFNVLYYAVHPSVSGRIVDYDAYFCPLDSIRDWNRMYGKRGFAQYQATFPLQNSAGLVELLEKISASSCASFLAVLKRLGPANPGLLSHPFEGYTITLDIPMRDDLIPLLRSMDKILLAHGGRLYCAKDVAALPETFAAMYPQLDAFRAIKKRLDPDNLFTSTMARRLGIIGE